ncbi:MAG: ATP-binding protein [Cyclobacteriaceae bacterium]|nr:ATP-binding protein [Cyclobacteriaceae bacterium]MCH8515642.1 ATP-binding protein [Cyclobacteriaceae bacterium]
MNSTHLIANPYKIGIIGPESSGKTTLCYSLAKVLDAVIVPEVAVKYLELLKAPYQESDLLKIATQQFDIEKKTYNSGERVVISDTNLLVIIIWSLEKYGQCNPKIIELYKQQRYDALLLCKPDLPWEYHPQRENPMDRDRLYDRYLQFLNSEGMKFEIIEGKGDKRVNKAIEYTRKNLN